MVWAVAAAVPTDAAGAGAAGPWRGHDARVGACLSLGGTTEEVSTLWPQRDQLLVFFTLFALVLQ